MKIVAINDTSNTIEPILADSSSTPVYSANQGKTLSWRVASLNEKSEAILTMLASEQVLAREWDTPEEDAQWADL